LVTISYLAINRSLYAQLLMTLCLGRFISEDPFGFSGSGPNVYAYASDSPTNLLDPFGLQSVGTVVGSLTEEVEAYISRLELQFAAESTEAVIGNAAGTIGGGAGFIFIPLKGPAQCDDEICPGVLPSWAGRPNGKIDPTRSPLPRPIPDSDPDAAPSLAGRYTGGGRPGQPGNGDDDCNEQWENARDYCSELLATPRSSPDWNLFKGIWGGNFERCVKGQVDQRCGGGRID
jgi:hypothetical protein